MLGFPRLVLPMLLSDRQSAESVKGDSLDQWVYQREPMLLDVLDQATVAAQQRNWSLVNQCLQQLPLPQKEAKSKQHSATQPQEAEIDSSYLDQILNLALDVLAAGDFQERWDVAKIFPKLGMIAVAPLIEILEDEDAELESRWFAGRILGEFNDPAVIKALVDLLKTAEDEDLAGMAATALANLGSSAIDSLTELIAAEETRLSAVQALAQIRRSEVISPLLQVVEDPSVTIRSTAIEALSSFHDSRIPPVLINALKDTAAPVRKEAVIGLGMRSDLLGELDLVTQLKPLLFDLNQEVCQQAATALGRLGTDSSAEALFQVLKSPHTPIALQINIIRVLPQTAAGLDYLQQMLGVESVVLWQEIIMALGRVAQPDLIPSAVQILQNALDSGHPATQTPSIRQAIALAWGQLEDDSALSSLIQLLADPDTGVKLHVIAALKKFPLAHQQLEQLANHDQLSSALQQGIAFALQEW